MAKSLRISEPIELQYSRQADVERLIATGRVVLAVFSLLAIWLDPSTPAKYVEITYALLTGYAGYAVLMALLVWRSYGLLIRLRLITHVFDLTVFSLVMYLTEGSASPFFVYFVFSLFCATLRWQRRGTLWTAAAAVAAYIGISVYAVKILHDPDFELNRFIIRSVYLIVVTALLGYLGTYAERLRSELSKLAAWPRATPRETPTLVREVLTHAAGLLAAPRALFAWQDPEEPWPYVASWSHGKFQWTSEPLDTFQPLVAAPLTNTSFLCSDAGAPVPTVYYTSSGSVQRWDGVPLHADLRARFAITAVLSSGVRGETLEGRLFFLDKPRMTLDDLVLGEIVARQVMADMEQLYLSQQLQQTATMAERVRLARDLHDGLLQSLTGATLHLETVHRLLAQDQQGVRERVRDVQRVLVAEQRDLRFFIQELRPAPVTPSETSSSLATRLQELGERIQRQWGLHVDICLKHLGAELPESLAYEIYRMAHEALINVARHAQASAVHVELEVQGEQVCLSVVDNGRGFPFQGHYGLATLMESKLGPRTIRERVASLGGSLVIDSSPSGAHLEITVPLTQLGA